MSSKKRLRPGITVDNFGSSTNTSANLKIKMALKTIDEEVKKFVYKIINDSVQNTEGLYFKTEFKGVLYAVSLYSSETHAIVCKEWPILDFLELGVNKKLELEINMAVKKLLLAVKDSSNKYNPGDEEKIIKIN